jgi:amino-acid N-acetyltransferase
VYGAAALLRSAVVADQARGRGVGAALLDRLLEHARARGVRQVYLLTTTAEDWFPRFGFTRIARQAVPAALHASAEFRGACPDSATVMQATLA